MLFTLFSFFIAILVTRTMCSSGCVMVAKQSWTVLLQVLPHLSYLQFWVFDVLPGESSRDLCCRAAGTPLPALCLYGWTSVLATDSSALQRLGFKLSASTIGACLGKVASIFFLTSLKKNLRGIEWRLVLPELSSSERGRFTFLDGLWFVGVVGVGGRWVFFFFFWGWFRFASPSCCGSVVSVGLCCFVWYFFANYPSTFAVQLFQLSNPYT